MTAARAAVRRAWASEDVRAAVVGAVVYLLGAAVLGASVSLIAGAR